MTNNQVQTSGSPLLYSPQRALEAVQAVNGLSPVRLFSVLFPLWEVEITGTQRRSRDYELVEYFVSRCIADGGLRSIAGIAAFLGLSERHVDQALAFLKQVGHLSGSDGNLTLTRLGRESVADGVSYREMETRRKLYFDAFGCRPLSREHYRLRVLSAAEAEAQADHHFLRLFSFRSWQQDALAALARRPDRGDYNLPDEVQDVHERAVAWAYLPLYIVQAIEHRSSRALRARFVALSQVRGLRDLFFEEIVRSEPELVSSLEADAVPVDVLQALLREEPARRGLDAAQTRLERTSEGAWRVVVAPEVFQPPGTRVALLDIGRYWLVRGYCLQVWCNDPLVRQQAALVQVNRIVGRWRRKATTSAVTELLEALSRKLEATPLTVAELRQVADHETKECKQATRSV